MTETIGNLVRLYADQLQGISDTPQLDCYLLVGCILNQPREWLMAHSDELICDTDLAGITNLLHRRLAGEPLAYIRGRQSFWKREFLVTPDTLIPRPETELLIDIILDRFDAQPRQVLDLGTGSGAIAISLAEERPAWHIHATDLVDNTVAVAKQNTGGLGNLYICVADWWPPGGKKFDIIVSNPPYIKEGDDHLAALQFEPATALVAGTDGLDCIRVIIAAAHDHLEPGGYILLEHGYDQQEIVTGLLEAADFNQVEKFSDLQGQPRAVLARGKQP